MIEEQWGKITSLTEEWWGQQRLNLKMCLIIDQKHNILKSISPNPRRAKLDYQQICLCTVSLIKGCYGQFKNFFTIFFKKSSLL